MEYIINKNICGVLFLTMNRPRDRYQKAHHGIDKIFTLSSLCGIGHISNRPDDRSLSGCVSRGFEQEITMPWIIYAFVFLLCHILVIRTI